jgi:cytochrome c peroxidase
MPIRHPIRLLVLLLGIPAVFLIAAGVPFGVLRSDDRRAPRGPHASVGEVPAGDLAAIMAAARAAASDTPRADLAADGRRLFRSSALAKTGESCASCHLDGGGTNAELGTILHPQQDGDFTGPRDVPSLWGVDRTAPYGWGGRTSGLDEFVVGTITSHFTAGSSQPDAQTGRQTAAIAAYLRTLEAPVTAFDQGTLTPAALRGQELFQGKGACFACHSGPFLTDNAFHDTKVPRITPGDNDPGAAATGVLLGTFNTPQLRDVRNTAPYMHNGSLKTLRDLVVFYDRRSSVAPLHLTAQEIDDLVAYLESL